MPRKIRELIHDLREAGFYEILGGGKGSHRKFAHARYAVTLSGQTGDDAKPYQASVYMDSTRFAREETMIACKEDCRYISGLSVSGIPALAMMEYARSGSL
jgi:predicted RNA binding protein YcfA (HicA-like mRNA interferase family)